MVFGRLGFLPPKKKIPAPLAPKHKILEPPLISTYTYTHTFTHAQITHTHVHTRTYTHAHTYTHRPYTRTHTCIQTHTLTHLLTHSLAPIDSPFRKARIYIICILYMYTWALGIHINIKPLRINRQLKVNRNYKER